MEHITNKNANHFITNIFYAFLAQGISLVLSLMMSFIVPKLLGVKEFAYWQLFIFYANYTGFFSLGINDGVYLHLGGKSYEELDHPMLGSQMWFSIAVQCGLALFFSFYVFHFESEPQRRFVFYCTVIQMVICNAGSFLGMVFQAVNQTKLFSLSVIIDKIAFLVFIVLIIAYKRYDFRIFIVLFLFSKVISLIYCFCKGNKIVFASMQNFRAVLSEAFKNMAVGIHLLISNFAETLILGMGRFLIDGLWGVETFGQVSLSLSLTNFVLLFLNQISMVLFPTLRRFDTDKLKAIYKTGRDFLGIALAGVLLFYLPVRYILGLWLPQYRESLVYLALLLPICTFDGKMEILCSTYLKVLRKERFLLVINLLSLSVSFILCMVSAFILHSLNAIVVSMVISAAFRSVISDLFMSRFMGIPIIRSILQEITLVVVFVLSTWFLNPLWSFFLYLFAYGTYLWFSKSTLREMIRQVKAQLKARGKD